MAIIISLGVMIIHVRSCTIIDDDDDDDDDDDHDDDDNDAVITCDCPRLDLSCFLDAVIFFVVFLGDLGLFLLPERLDFALAPPCCFGVYL